MANNQDFYLCWNNHQSNFITAFHDLRIGEDFVDVTLACEGQSLQAHKVVLSACSPFFRDLLKIVKATPCKHPVIVLKDILYYDLLALVEFVYHGEVRVKHQRLPSFLRTAEVLKVRGLTESLSKLKNYHLPESQSSVLHASVNDCPSVSNFAPDNNLIATQLGNSLRLSPGLDNTGSDSTRHLGNVKIEEDLDSASEEGNIVGTPGTLQFHHVQDIVRNGEKRKEPQREKASANPPLLTLQSFARIPVSATQDNIPSLIQQSTPGFPEPCNDERQPQLEPSDHNGSESLFGRTPGRSSSSDRPRWPCPFCVRLLSSRSSVRRHIEDRHTNNTSRHPCPLCERLYRTRNSLQYHLSTAHRDREPGPRGRPRTHPRSPFSMKNIMTRNKSPLESEMSLENQPMVSIPRISLNGNSVFGNPQISSTSEDNPSRTKSPGGSEVN